MTAAILKAAANHQLPDWMWRRRRRASGRFSGISSGSCGMARCFWRKRATARGWGGKTEAYRDGSYDYYISETVGSYDIKGTGAYIQAACAYEGSESHA